MKSNAWRGFAIAVVVAIALDLIWGWPSALVAGALAGLYFKKARRAFAVGFLAVGVAWAIMAWLPALWSPTGALADRLVQVLGLSSDFAFLMFILT